MTQTPITTTLAKIREFSPCEDGYKKLCKNLGGVRKYGKDTPVKFSQIVESNGLDDAVWCLQTICPEYEKEVRLFAADCAESVLHIYEKKYPDDLRPREAIQAARDFAEGKITAAELTSASWAADRASFSAAACDAWDAFAVARASARASASWAAWAAARKPEREKQKKMLIERFG